MNINCPHCNRAIELVGAAELKAEYNLSPNMVAHYKKVGSFPDPVFAFGNRHIYLRSDVDSFTEKRARENVAKVVDTLLRDIQHLPQKEQEAARKLLEEKIVNGGTSKPRTRGRKT